MAEMKSYVVGNETRRGRVYRDGAKAYIDGFSGMIPCTVIKVLKPCNGRAINQHELIVRIDQTIGGYNHGERVTCDAAYTPPRSQCYLRGYRYCVNVNYIYEMVRSVG